MGHIPGVNSTMLFHQNCYHVAERDQTRLISISAGVMRVANGKEQLFTQEIQTIPSRRLVKVLMLVQ